jgi:hypothetical protein
LVLLPLDPLSNLLLPLTYMPVNSRSVVIFFFLISCTSYCFAQTIENISVTFDNVSGGVNIRYDLNSKWKSKRYKVDVFCSEDKGATFSAALVGISGDAGYNIRPGEGKLINWAYFIDLPDFKGKDVVFKVVAKEDTEYQDNLTLSLGGPEKFYQSVLIPGYGNYHVRKGKGYMAITAAVGVLLATGTYMHFKANGYYSDYKNSTTAEMANSNFRRAEQLSTTSKALLGAGGAIWTIDIGQVIFKGISNRRKQRQILEKRQK